MSPHWAYVSAAWGLGALLFLALLASTLRRQANAKRRLAALEAARPARGARAPAEGGLA